MDNITTYFNGEKLQCLIGAIFSVLCVAASVYFHFLESSFLTGLSYTIMPLSIILLIICIGIIVRTPKDIKRVTTFQKETPENIQKEELPRMEKVLKSFKIIKKVEIMFLLIGLVMAILFWQDELISGIAIGLVIMGIALYTFDYIAELRGKSYVQFLTSIEHND